jgi:hypothetical protein
MNKPIESTPVAAEEISEQLKALTAIATPFAAQSVGMNETLKRFVDGDLATRAAFVGFNADSGTLKKLMDADLVTGSTFAHFNSINDKLKALGPTLGAGTVGVSDTLKRYMDGDIVKGSASARFNRLSDELKQNIENVTASERLLNGPVGITDELRRSWEQTSLLSSNVDRALSSMAPSAWYHDDLKLPSLPPLEFAPNPILETNSQLAELTGTVTQLVDVARQQAELSQAIRTTTELALKYAIQSGEDAKAATLLARKSVRLTAVAITIAIITTVASIVVSYSLSNSTDARMKEEIHVLGDISGKLTILTNRPATDPSTTTKPQSKRDEGKPPAGAKPD